jgi:hypothetical protein
LRHWLLLLLKQKKEAAGMINEIAHNSKLVVIGHKATRAANGPLFEVKGLEALETKR